jgi:hypothetical protein
MDIRICCWLQCMQCSWYYKHEYSYMLLASIYAMQLVLQIRICIYVVSFNICNAVGITNVNTALIGSHPHPT